LLADEWCVPEVVLEMFQELADAPAVPILTHNAKQESGLRSPQLSAS